MVVDIDLVFAVYAHCGEFRHFNGNVRAFGFNDIGRIGDYYFFGLTVDSNFDGGFFRYAFLSGHFDEQVDIFNEGLRRGVDAAEHSGPLDESGFVGIDEASGDFVEQFEEVLVFFFKKCLHVDERVVEHSGAFERAQEPVCVIRLDESGGAVGAAEFRHIDGWQEFSAEEIDDRVVGGRFVNDLTVDLDWYEIVFGFGVEECGFVQRHFLFSEFGDHFFEHIRHKFVLFGEFRFERVASGDRGDGGADIFSGPRGEIKVSGHSRVWINKAGLFVVEFFIEILDRFFKIEYQFIAEPFVADEIIGNGPEQHGADGNRCADGLGVSEPGIHGGVDVSDNIGHKPRGIGVNGDGAGLFKFDRGCVGYNDIGESDGHGGDIIDLELTPVNDLAVAALEREREFAVVAADDVEIDIGGLVFDVERLIFFGACP